MDDCTIFTCGEIWKDIRSLSKQITPSFTDTEFSHDEFDRLSDNEKTSAIPLLRQITTVLKNNTNKLNEIPNNVKNGKQPFLSKNWTMWKMRWGIDNRGPSYGLRIMYCINHKHIVLVNIKHKKFIKENEIEFQKETIERMESFLACDYKKWQ